MRVAGWFRPITFYLIAVDTTWASKHFLQFREQTLELMLLSQGFRELANIRAYLKVFFS